MAPRNFLPVFRVSGTNYEIGFQVGRKFKDRINLAFEQSMFWKYLREHDRRKPDWFDQIHDHAKKHYPQYLEELTGTAESADIDYRDLALLNFRVTRLEEECSTVIFKQQDKIILAQNEDHEIPFGEQSYLLIVELENGTSFFAHTYPGNLPGFSFSFNSHGIVMSANALPDPEVGIGIPRHLLDRAMLEATTIEDAVQRAQRSPRSGAFSYNLASLKEKQAVNLETTSEKAFLTKIDERYFHTNHYISNRFQGIPIPSGTTQRRYERGIELLPHAEKSGNGAFKLLSDDKIFQSPQKSIIGSEEVTDGTLCTAVFEISEDIVLRIYPPPQQKEGVLQFSLSDLA